MKMPRLPVTDDDDGPRFSTRRSDNSGARRRHGTKLFRAETALVAAARVPRGECAIAPGGQLWNQLCRNPSLRPGERGKEIFLGRRGPHEDVGRERIAVQPTR